MNEKLTCPICGQEIAGAPALSRTDNRTQICADCGTRQALAAIGVTNEDAVIARIHDYEAHRAQKEEQLEAEPVRRGKWGSNATCKACGESLYELIDSDSYLKTEIGLYGTPFCPFCGADMWEASGA